MTSRGAGSGRLSACSCPCWGWACSSCWCGPAPPLHQTHGYRPAVTTPGDPASRRRRPPLQPTRPRCALGHIPTCARHRRNSKPRARASGRSTSTSRTSSTRRTPRKTGPPIGSPTGCTSTRATRRCAPSCCCSPRISIRNRRSRKPSGCCAGAATYYDAWIEPVCYHDDDQTVDMHVRVRDVWSLNPGVSFSRKGGANGASAEIEDQDFLGRGEIVSLVVHLERRSHVARALYEDPQLFGSWWRGRFAYSDNSDGTQTQVARRPPLLLARYSLERGNGVAVRRRVTSRATSSVTSPTSSRCANGISISRAASRRDCATAGRAAGSPVALRQQ